MVYRILKISEAYLLTDSYTGETLSRHAEISGIIFSKAGKMIGKKTGLKLIKEDKPTLEYESPGEKNPAKLDLTESCYTSPEITITAEIKNPQNIVQADDNLTKILDAAITSIKELGKSTGAVRKA